MSKPRVLYAQLHLFDEFTVCANFWNRFTPNICRRFNYYFELFRHFQIFLYFLSDLRMFLQKK
ncbi:hypothetical protein CW304_21755 [Bacillus sp. UFRGS-B20]|nr:hypothetical protein CW304_21755 [Bacillus sp. UFRGS-B20]